MACRTDFSSRTGNNMLQEIPPQIAQLIHLQELNVKNNQLRYLPAEMLGMRLQTLEIEPNPWMTTMELAGTESLPLDLSFRWLDSQEYRSSLVERRHQ